MARTIRYGRLVVGTLAVLGALGFGATQAFAGAQRTNSGTCSPSSIGTCTSTLNCQLQCDAIYGQGVTDGRCSFGCCRCLAL